MSTLNRRVARLEGGDRSGDTDIAEVIRRARERSVADPEGVRREADERYRDMAELHRLGKLRGLRLQVFRAMERVRRHDQEEGENAHVR